MTGAPALKKGALSCLSALNRFETYIDNKRQLYGEFWVTPMPVSHSAIDAHMFLIECDGKRILHTGDFRDHGYYGKELLEGIKQSLTHDIDILITEGTMLSRNDQRVMSEEQVQEEAVKIFKSYKYNFVLCSSMDADRLTSFILASQRENRKRRIVADDYQIKQICLIKKYLPEPYSKIFAYNLYKNTEDEIDRMKQYGFLMFVRNSKTFEKSIESIMKAGINPSEVTFIYSQFKGYILKGHKAYNQNLDKFVHLYNWNLLNLHTSGHASKEALKEVCEFVNPTTAIIPIHKEKKGTLQSLELNVKCPIVEESTNINNIEIIIK